MWQPTNDAPPGWDAWYANDGSTYYSPWFAVANIAGLTDGRIHYNATDYSTALIGNYSLAWLRTVGGANAAGGAPFFAYIGTKACHDPFAPAPWYTDVWSDEWPGHAPRTPNFNVSRSALAKHHPTVASRLPISEQTATCIDDDFRNRWRTLLSVDDIVASTIALTDELNITSRTYFVYTSECAHTRIAHAHADTPTHAHARARTRVHARAAPRRAATATRSASST